MKKIYFLFVAAALAACSAEPVENESINSLNAAVAGKNKAAVTTQVADVRNEWTYSNNGGVDQGKVTISNNCDSVTLQFEQLDGDSLDEVEFDLTTSLPNLNNGGNLSGTFPYSFNDLDENLSFSISFTDLGITAEDNLYVFAKAWGEWAGNSSHGKLNYFTYDVVEVNCDTSKICETAYLKGEIILKDYYNQKADGGNNWGWAAELNLEEGKTTDFEIWAAAGQNNTSKGVQIGSATVSYDGSVKVNLLSGYESSEVHVFVADALPATRPIPGKFKGYSETISDGQFFLILHMEVCWEE